MCLFLSYKSLTHFSHPGYSAGRRHLLGLDAKHQVWLFTSWGRPVAIRSSQISDPTSRLSRVVQVEAGWSLIAILTEAGHVLVEWPFEGALKQKIRTHHNMMSSHPNSGKDTRLPRGSNVLTCAAWAIDHDFLELPGLPGDLPPLNEGSNLSESDDPPSEELRIVKIAAGEYFVVALTNQGHVLKMTIQAQELEHLREQFRLGSKNWEYVCFSRI